MLCGAFATSSVPDLTLRGKFVVKALGFRQARKLFQPACGRLARSARHCTPRPSRRVAKRTMEQFALTFLGTIAFCCALWLLSFNATGKSLPRWRLAIAQEAARGTLLRTIHYSIRIWFTNLFQCLKAMKIPAAKAAVDKEWEKLEKI